MPRVDGFSPRVTIRPGFPGHVFFLGGLGRCPGVRAGFRKWGGLSGFLAQSAYIFERCRLHDMRQKKAR